MTNDERAVFRLQPFIHRIVAAAASLWVLLLLVLLWQREAFPARTWLSVIFFIVLFGAVLVFYNGVTITADRYGVTYRGLMSFRTYPYESMLGLDIRRGISGLVNYDVITRVGLLQFTSFFKDHRRLMQIIVERADLDRRGRVQEL